jgi:hypothetical protein
MNSSKIALFVAAALGLVGAAVNWIYLDSKSKQFEKIEFLSVAPGTTILPGDRFTEDKLAPIAIPKDNVRRELDVQAIRWADRQTVIGMTAVYSFDGGKIILQQDLKTPPPTMELTREDERGLPIPVDTRTFVPSLVNPGDMVTFVVGGIPAPATTQDPDAAAEQGEPSSPQPTPVPAALRNARIETIGPFRVLSIGNRLGSADVLKASGVSQVQENVMTIAVKMQGDQLEPKAVKLLALMQAGGSRQAGVLLHPRTNK